MKINGTMIRCSLLILLATILLSSCNNDDYLIDGGISSPYYDGNVMEFLESRPDLFDDLVKVVKMTKWENVFRNESEEITFFAPTDFSIENSVTYLNDYLYKYTNKDKITDFSQIKPEVWEDLLAMYVMKGKYRLKDIAQIDTVALSTFPGQTNFTYDESYKMTMGVYYEDANGIKYAGARRVLYSYPDAGRIYSYVSTCNLEPHNGIIHVLRLDHYLGFLRSLLYDKASEIGILYPAPSTDAPIDRNKKQKNLFN